MYVKRIVLKRLEDIACIIEAAHGSRESGDNGFLPGQSWNTALTDFVALGRGS